jgi:hypothetical protein
MPKDVQAVVRGSGARIFAAAIQRSLAKRTTRGSFEQDGPDPVAQQAIADLSEAVELLAAQDRDDGVLFAAENRTAALLMSFIARKQPAPATSQEFFESQLAHDDFAGWINEFVPAWLKGRFKKREFVVPNGVFAAPNYFRLAVVGDWGSGLYGAPISAASIQSAKPAFDAVLHLGDVYYAGTKHEVTERFLNLWPDVPGASSWALNSNHEMYSGGEGYFDVTLKDERFKAQLGSSCFAWENAHFLFLGLDSALENHAIGPHQKAWIYERAQTAAGKKLILFSHHQPFSAFESDGPRLVEVLDDLLGAGRVMAWYWGHEHRCVFFEKHVGWSMWGRCVGHGGFPQGRDKFDKPIESTNSDGSSCWREVSRPHVPDAWVLDGPNPYIPEHAEKYGPHGYLALHFDGPVIHESVHAPNGALLLKKQLG